MNQAAQLENIVSSVNETRFLEHMKTLFSTSTTVLAELLQNGRRAGANRIDFDYDEATSSLTIMDNGCGISDFRTLITVAESGWSEETIASERPFGIGFFSVSFSAKSVVVESRGKKIEFSSEDLIAKRQIAVQPSSFIGGTRIELIRCKLDQAAIQKALGYYARGFATPVFWRNEELPRPHAQANLNGVTTPVGFVHIPGLHGNARDVCHEPHGYVYCQGLPVAVAGFTRLYGPGNQDVQVVHVDHHVYSPRMPDRDSLIDADKAAKDFVEALKALWREHISVKKFEMSSDDFVDEYWDVAKAVGCLEVMSDVPVLPRHVVHYVVDTPVLQHDGDSYMSRIEARVTLDDVQSGSITLCKDFYEAENGDDFAKLTFAKKARLLFVNRGLPADHWANAFLWDFDEEEVKVSGKVVAQGDFSGGWVEGVIKLVDKLSLTMLGQTLLINEAFSVGENWDTAAFMVPLDAAKRGSHTGYVLRQQSTYVNENDAYCETDYELDRDRFDDQVAILAGEPGAETVKKCLMSAGAGRKTNLRNKTFTVRFDDEGSITVIEA